MGEKTPDMEEAIHLALEAAAAANDTATEVDNLSSDTRQAADRIDRLTRAMRPALFGVLGGAILSVGLGGLIYMRTLSEMRSATATQVEALSQFTQTVGALDAALQKTESLAAEVAALTAAQEAAFARLEDAIAAPDDIDQTDASLPNALGDPVGGGDACNMASQMVQSLPGMIEENHRATREAVTMSVSDLQLALSRMLANRPTPVPAAAPQPAAKPKPRPAATPAATRPRTKPRQQTAPQPVAPNPFSYP